MTVTNVSSLDFEMTYINGKGQYLFKDNRTMCKAHCRPTIESLAVWLLKMI